jgi:uncharacterized protein (DUF2249 family)
MNPTTHSIDPSRFDVREIPCRVKHAQIFQRWADLPVGKFFVLINDHDPVPLWYQFAAQFPGAFEWEYLLRGPEEFQVKITKTRAVAMGAQEAPSPAAMAATCSAPKGDTIEVDARGLEPPEPLLRILNALETLPPGKRLRAITDREPCHLFGAAEQRGFRHECTEQPDASWSTILARA